MMLVLQWPPNFCMRWKQTHDVVFMLDIVTVENLLYLLYLNLK